MSLFQSLVFAVGCTLVCLGPSTLLAQQYTARRIVFRNPGPYAEAELQAMSPIQPGSVFTKAQLAAAAAQLSDSGYFDDVQGSLEGPIKSIDVQFTLTPIDQAKLIQPGYENFVWFVPGDLAATLVKTVPLLSHGIPEAGQQQVAVQTAIEKLLAAKSVTASVTHELIQPSTGHPSRVFEYSVETPAVVLHSATLSGVAPVMEPAMKLVLAGGSTYNEGLAGQSTADRLLEPYFNAGYVDAKLLNLQRSIADASSPNRVQVDLTATLEAGEPYRVSSLSFAGTPLVTPEVFAKSTRLHAQDLASRRALYASLAPLTQAYHDHGYMDAVVDAAPAADPATHRVAYTVTVVPGQQYHVKSVEAKGLSSAQRSDFQAAFNLHPGDIYDESYIGTFLIHNNNIRSLQGYSGNFTAVADPETLGIDVILNFQQNSITVR